MEKNKELYKEYEDLLMRRDQMYKDADSYQIEYNREFGDLITKNFELKIECIRRKKTIAACLRRMNRNLPIDVSEMMEDIEKEMTAYLKSYRNSDTVELENLEICELMLDDEKKNEFREALEEEKSDYESCIRQLDRELEKLIGKEGISLVWKPF